MRLLLLPGSKGHTDTLAHAVSWNSNGDVYTCADDKCVRRWSGRGEALGKVCALDTCFADLHCYPLGSRDRQASSTDMLAVACTDGTLKLIGSNGRLEKSTEAHAGAVLCVRWSPDGSLLATSGEDGQVKVWSRAGMLRSTIVAADAPVHCVAWGGSSYAADWLLVCSSSYVSIKALQGAGTAGTPGGGAQGDSSSMSSQASWKAHDGVVLRADWNASTNLIVTGGEDCRYKVWDAYGRLLYQSSPWKHPITSVAWSPDGALFAAGSFNSLALCDRQGWSHCQVQPSSGSLLGLCWSRDGTKVAAVGGSGALVVAAVLEAVVEDGRVTATLVEERVIAVTDIGAETRERLEFRDPVVMMSIRFGHLVACTSGHCHIYTASNWNTPHIFDLKEQPQLLLQCSRNFVLLDATAGFQVLTYEGRQVCAIKPPGLQPEGICRQLVSLSSDTLALAVGASVRCFETAQGRPVGEGVINHGLEVTAVAISQAGTAADRLLALLDSNGDLYLTRLTPSATSSSATAAAAAATRAAALASVVAPGAPGAATTPAGLITASGLVAPGSGQQLLQQRRRLLKLAANVASPPVWHETAPMLAAVVDGQLVVWAHPAAAFTDPDLLQATRVAVNTDSCVGAGTSVDLFSGSRLVVRCSSGAHTFAAIAPQPVLLHELARQGRWDKALRLARFSGDAVLWACLAALAMAAGELAAAEAAFAAIDAADKLQYVLHVRSLAGGAAAAAAAAGDPVVAAELAVYAGQVDEAEAKLLKAGLVYRAIKLHTRLHNWQRALQLAQRQKQHVDTVLMLRRRYLAASGQAEVLPELQAAAKEVVVDEAAVRTAIQRDKAAEAAQRAAVRQGGRV